MVIAADAQANAAVTAVGQFGIGQGIKIQIDHIVQGAHCSGYHIRKAGVVFHRKITQGEACQVADNKIPGAGCGDDDGIPVF